MNRPGRIGNGQKSAENGLARIVSGLGILICGILFTASLIPAPEAAVRSPDFLPFTCGWLILFGGIIAVRLFRSRRGGSSDSLLTGKGKIPSWLLGIFLAWGFLSYQTSTGNPILAGNQFWSTAGILLFYFVFRLLGGNALGRRTMLTALLTVVLAETFFAGWCYTVKDPALREEFRADPDKVLAENGMNFPPGSPERLQLENRLLNSTEPLGTYGLTNTLAGVLVPGIVWLLTLIFWYGSLFLFNRKEKYRLIAALTALILLLPACAVLLLTKSRSGYAAVFAGVFFALGAVFWAVLRFRPALAPEGGTSVPNAPLILPQSVRQFLRWCSIIIPVLFIGTLAAAWFGGILDREVFTEAKKSLGYRLDYWQASSRIIAAKPFIGTGPGNFQASYTRYMSPTASEVVADPHNFFFEAAAVFGLPAGLLLLGFIAAAGISSFRYREPASRQSEETSKFSRLSLFALLTVLGGIGLGYAVSLKGTAPVDFDFILAAVPAAVIAVPSAGLFCAGTIPPMLYFPPFFALLVNLLAAGGIFFPACGLILFLFAALAAGREENHPSGTSPQASRRRILSLYYIEAGLILVCFAFACWNFHNICRANRLESEALAEWETTGKISQGNILKNTDSIPVCRYVLQAALEEYLRNPKTNQLAVISGTDLQRLFRTSPESALIRFDAGKLYLQAYQHQNKAAPALLEPAAVAFAEAVERFPTNAEYRAYYGITLLRTGQDEKGRAELKAALSLDEQTPHKDRKLSDSLRKAAEANL